MFVNLRGFFELSNAGHGCQWNEDAPSTNRLPRIIAVATLDEQHPLVAMQTRIFNDGKSLGDAINSAEGHERNGLRAFP